MNHETLLTLAITLVELQATSQRLHNTLQEKMEMGHAIEILDLKEGVDRQIALTRQTIERHSKNSDQMYQYIGRAIATLGDTRDGRSNTTIRATTG